MGGEEWVYSVTSGCLFQRIVFMIQRLQTVLLFLAAALCVASLFLPNWLAMDPGAGDTGDSMTISATGIKIQRDGFVSSETMDFDHPETIFPSGEVSIMDNTMMVVRAVLVVLIALLLLVTIFMYNNRGLQIRMAYGAVFLLMVQFLLLVPIGKWLQEMAYDATKGCAECQSLPQWGLGTLVVAMLLAWWAVKRIQKDEKLVKGMDRLR
jgi:hypothetical protein